MSLKRGRKKVKMETLSLEFRYVVGCAPSLFMWILKILGVLRFFNLEDKLIERRAPLEMRICSRPKSTRNSCCMSANVPH
jgi:hypothetical protein